MYEAFVLILVMLLFLDDSADVLGRYCSNFRSKFLAAVIC